MKIKVKKKANGKIKSSYKVTAYYMDGDADGWNDDSIIIKESELEDSTNQAEFESLILTLERCCAAYQNGKGGMDGYEDVEGYEKHLGWDPSSVYTLEHVSGGYCDDCISSFEDWGVLYYDALGNEFPVNITFDKKEKESIEVASKVTW
jgi:hypothetical protein